MIAGPLLKRDTILVMEEVLAYPDGEIFSTAYVTTTLGTQSNPNPVTQVATSSGVLGIGDHPSSNDIAMDTAKYIEDHVDQAVKTRTGFISPIDDLFSEMALFHTNAHRINSSVPALTWDHSLADKAQIWVDLCITNEESGR